MTISPLQKQLIEQLKKELPYGYTPNSSAPYSSVSISQPDLAELIFIIENQ